MNDYRDNPVTISELLFWKRNKHIDPRTKRNIVKSGNIQYLKRTLLYKYLNSSYSQLFPNGYDVFDSLDERDPISLIYFYEIKDGEKILLYDNVENLILYEEIDSKGNIFVRCFEKESVSYMKCYKVDLHPVSKLKIPSSIFDLVEENSIIEEKLLTLKEKSLQVFQLFNNISIFIDFNLYLNLDRNELLKLNYELEDFYHKNLSVEQRKTLDGEDGNKIFKYKNEEFNDKSTEFIQFYILDQIESVIKSPNEDIKFMANYIILGGLSLVIDEVKEAYESFLFNF